MVSKNVITPIITSSQTLQSSADDSMLEVYLRGLNESREEVLQTWNIDQKLDELASGPRLHAETNVLEYWLNLKFSKPDLHQLAVVALSVPTTQVSVERAFSALALVLTDHRTRLSEETLENILILRLNKNLFDDLKFVHEN